MVEPITDTLLAVAEAAGSVGAAAPVVAETTAVVTEGAGVAAAATETAGLAKEASPFAAQEVMDLARGAEASVDLLAGEHAIRALTEFPDSLGGPVETAPDVVNAFTAEQEGAVHAITESSLQKWNREHPQPDPNTNPEAYRQWCEDQWNVETEYIADARTEVSMTQWDREHPEPKAIKFEEHKRWLEAREKQKKEFQKRFNEEARDTREAERASVLAEINRLRQLTQERVDIVEGIKAIRRKSDLEKTDQDKIDLARFQVRKSELDIQIDAIQASLREKASRSGPLIALLINTALMSALAVGALAYGAAQKEHFT
ncbi:hypothetical protein A3H80_00640 [Candidatus Roizmanbacteria bacterium RIFCSPLOWO2_02_FULL_37_19]|uniref:Uncharacterized protein n=1 Tax=Candidatus Roizmanbacteria bacterium RIFCSPHIGHO2_02_FULL_37_24 TaxID=1802037 RepID=A0A1F7GV35_9BACT|nr:MAG: hypothetical protein A2862_00330 [Candidatus Roizmanbacteria bacterium RIFCSPHIGHO2_01_FULL_38_41]OGK22644.1 MAG: hypothetical protein A3C24_00445 [Candidatus Roizmanbacteria bacterium RIFCSPHIGHO2_02_FULL_37_24]OGK32494.1 MAG: hypothetical protein A3E10_00510 [Candidatus Roizmanbacteria bacterium RIFCSPHIGHO2_12_FULL_37_23]OGK45109.1 MAG: hypothetical protein A2956_02915 [Candidatus Roizmanbacteria bacterium RIFCSPLOWO2_01_FULL_37_57]OGK54474.1 MAG: hypothetical protein A3H80_00640 [Ca